MKIDPNSKSFFTISIAHVFLMITDWLKIGFYSLRWHNSHDEDIILPFLVSGKTQPHVPHDNGDFFQLSISSHNDISDGPLQN